MKRGPLSNERLCVNGKARTAEVPTIMRFVALTLGLAALWGLTRRFQGLALDGEIYAAQAASRIHPNLANDLYLAHTSQDSFTVFSPLYARLIEWWGLPAASKILFVACTVAFLAAAWLCVRRLVGERSAWLSVAMLICTVAPYGAYGIFEFSSNYLTARSLAEALVVVSLAAFYSRRPLLGAAVMLTAMLVHPLMALPGMLLLLCLSMPLAPAVVSCAIAIAVVATLAQVVAHHLVANRLLVVMDPVWLDVVRERSLFLFLRYWRLPDWQLQLRPFLCLGLTFACAPDPRVRKLCAVAALVGLGGFLVAAVTDTAAPLALLVQGQAWRWCWVTSLVAVAMLAPTALQLWRDGGGGYFSAVLLVAAWTFPPIDSTMLSALALLVWLLRGHISADRGRALKYAAYVLLCIIGLWTVANFWLVTQNTKDPHAIARSIEWLRGAFTLRPLAIALFGLWVHALYKRRTPVWPELLAGAALTAAVLPTAIEPANRFAVVRDRDQVADWRAIIPETSTVLLVPAHMTAGFQWFTLERPSYLTQSQSAGVVFSPLTAAEVRRRGENLTPLWPPDWKITSQIQAAARGEPSSKADAVVLTAEKLQKICADDQLGFVVAKEILGFDALRETHRGAWKDWNLYDCRRVRAAGGGA